jgi:hypothetical protein
MTLLSCHRFRTNEVQLWLSLVAYNLGNLWRWLALLAPIGKWSPISLQQLVGEDRRTAQQTCASDILMSMRGRTDPL